MDETKRKNDWTPASTDRGRLVGAALLIGIGLLLLLMNFVPSLDVGRLIVLLIGAIFLVAAFITREEGFLIPGSIMTGLGAGVWLIAGVVEPVGIAGGAIVVLGLALGFLAIMPLTTLLGKKSHWWPLIPGGIIGTVGVLMLLGDPGLGILELLGKVWPIFLIALGVYTLLRRGSRIE